MENREKKLEVLNVNYSSFTTRLSKKFRERKLYKPLDKRDLICFIPGTIIELLVKEGDSVSKGDEVLVLEAMKMKNRIKSPVNGKVAEINVSIGKKISKGVLMIRFE